MGDFCTLNVKTVCNGVVKYFEDQLDKKEERVKNY